MGEPVRIAEVAKRMIEASERKIDIVYTGLRPGEKLEEDLFGDGEVRSPTDHPLITEVGVPPLKYSTLVDKESEAVAMEWLSDLPEDIPTTSAD